MGVSVERKAFILKQSGWGLNWQLLLRRLGRKFGTELKSLCRADVIHSKIKTRAVDACSDAEKCSSRCNDAGEKV